MKSILNFRDFVIEALQDQSGGTSSMTLEEAIAIATAETKASNKFIEFLRSPFARKYSQYPFKIVSTKRQIKNGSFLFSMEGSYSDRAVGIFGNGYVRTVPFGPGAEGKSQVVTTYETVIHQRDSGLVQLKTSMNKVSTKEREKILADKMYELLSNFVDSKLDTSDPGQFPKFKRGIQKEDRPRITFVDKSGNDIETFVADSVKFSSQSRNWGIDETEEGSIIAGGVRIKNTTLNNALIDPNAVMSIDLNVAKSNIENSDFLPATSLEMVMKDSTMYNCLIKSSGIAKLPGNAKIEIKNSKLENVVLSARNLQVKAEKSDVRGLKIDNNDGTLGGTSLLLSLEYCDVDGLQINKGSTVGMVGPFNVFLTLRGIKIADSKDLEKIVLDVINRGPGLLSTGDWRRDREEGRYGLGYVIEDCDFSGIDLRSLSIKNWLDKLPLMTELKIRNKNFDLSGTEIDDKISRITKTRSLFKR